MTFLVVVYIEVWGRRTKLSNVDLRSRLPGARARVLGLGVVFLLVCWLADVAMWSLVVAALVLSAGVAVVLGFISNAMIFLPAVLILLIREWAFGYPHLLLQPPQPSSEPAGETPARHTPRLDGGQLVGKVGRTVSPLRPCGDILLDGLTRPAVSEGGEWIDAEQAVVVMATRDGMVCVRCWEGDKC